MATALGLDVDQNGNGTTPDDLQRIIGSMYRTPGILSGCAVSQMPKMAYQVFAGAVTMQWGKDQMVAVPVVATEVPVDANTGSSDRVDRVYVQQRTVSADGDNLAIVGATQGAIPDRSILLAEYRVPAGATTTQGAVDTANRIYTRPVGGQYGQVAKSVDTDTTPHTGKLLSTRGKVNLFFGAMWAGVAPTDRDLMVHFTSCISSADNARGASVGSVIYKFFLNDQMVATWERKFDEYWEAKTFSFPLVIQQAQNTMYYTTQWKAGQVDWQVRYGGKDRYPGDQLVVLDHGVANL